MRDAFHAELEAESYGCHCHHLELALKHAVIKNATFKKYFDLLSALSSSILNSDVVARFIRDAYVATCTFLICTDCFSRTEDTGIKIPKPVSTRWSYIHRTLTKFNDQGRVCSR